MPLGTECHWGCAIGDVGSCFVSRRASSTSAILLRHRDGAYVEAQSEDWGNVAVLYGGAASRGNFARVSCTSRVRELQEAAHLPSGRQPLVC